MTFRVLIIEDHNLVREALRSLVSGMHNFDVAGVACDGKQGVRSAIALQPDLILMDLSMPGMSGLDATADIRRRLPNVRIVLLTISRQPDFIREAFQIGADGYLLKGASLEEFESALNCVIKGKKYISNELSADIATSLHGGNTTPMSSTWKNLTGRERSILKLIAEGNTNRTTAEYLCISTKTVEKHRSSLMHKLGLRTAAELVLVAIEMGLIERAGVASSRRRPLPPPGAGPDPLRPNELGQFC
jgi:DNA-binding NarL/FixJ family response regulator